MAKAQRALTTGQYVTLISMFFLMCILRLPISLFILFGFALILTLFTGKKGYCAAYCPLGALQDYYPAKESPPPELPKAVRHLRWPVFSLFWGYLAYITVVSFQNPDTLWQSVLLLMILSMAGALILQTLVRKRIWCSKACPFGKVLDGAIKVRRIPQTVRKR